MTTDLDDRVAAALARRADSLVVERPPIDQVVAASAGRTPPPAGRRSVVAIAACVLAIGVVGAAILVLTGDGEGPRGPADATTTEPAPTEPAPLPEITLGHLPDGFVRDEVTVEEGADGLSRSFEAEGAPEVSGSGDVGTEPRRLAVSVQRVTRSDALRAAQEAPGGTDAAALVAEYAAGGSAPVGEVPDEPSWAAIRSRPSEAGRWVLVVGEEAVLVDAGRDRRDPAPWGGEPVRLVAVREDVEVRVTGDWLRLGELTSVLAGIDGAGSPIPVEPGGEADVPAGTSPSGLALLDLPAGWVPTLDTAFPGVTGEEQLAVHYQPSGAPAGQLLPVPPWIIAGVSVGALDPSVSAALDADDPDALLDATAGDVPSVADTTERRVVEVAGRPAVLEAARLDTEGGTPDVDGRTVLQATTWLGPEITLTLQSEGVGEADLLAALASVRLLG